MLYDTIAEAIKAALENTKAEGIEIGKAEGFEAAKAEGFEMGRAEGFAEMLTIIMAHRFPDQEEAFRQFLASSGRDTWPAVADMLNWTGTGTEFMNRLTTGQPDSS